MAESVIPNVSLSTGSEPVFDIVCHPCSSEGKNAEAEGYCLDCCEHLCAPCISNHKKYSILKHHKLVDKASMPKTEDTAQAMDVCTERCQTHKAEIIKYFCPAHKVLGCSACITLKHKLCEDVEYIPDVATGLEDRRDYTEFKGKLDDLIQTTNDIIQSSQASKDKSNENNSNVVQEIEAYRQELIDAVNRQVNDIKQLAKQINAQNNDRMDTETDKGSHVLVKLQSMSSDLSTLLSQKRYCQVFVQMKTKEQDLTELQGKLEDMDRTELSDYKFQPDEELRTKLRRGNVLGTLLMTSTKKNGQPTKGKSQTEAKKYGTNVASTDVQQTKTTHVADLNAKSAKEKKGCTLSGVALLSTDKLVIADYSNGTIKLIDTANNKILSEMKPEKYPWGVTVNKDKIIATLPSACKILFLNYKNRLTHDKAVSVNGYCMGVACSDDKLFVIFEKEKKLEVMTMAGVVLQRFDTNDRGHPLFQSPEYVTVSATNQSIYVSEWRQGQVKILGMDGKQKGVYEDDQLGCPIQLAVDKAGVMYLCDRSNDTVHLLSPQCCKIKVLLKKQDGLNAPFSVCYCENTRRLYVGMYGNNTVKVYQVS